MRREIAPELRQAVDTLKQGGVILYPTDTIWGIGCDATQEAAVERIFSIKSRLAEKSMIVLVDDAARIPYYVGDMPALAWDLIEYVTTPTTIVYEKARYLAKNLISDDGSIAIRVTKEQVSHDLCRLLGRPIVSTSANISGEPSPKCFAEISEEIKSRVDYIVPFRQEERGAAQPSRIIKLNANGVFKIIR